MSGPYATGCSQVCNAGSDCTEISQPCHTPAEAGNVRLLGDKPDSDMTRTDALGVLAILATSAVGVIYGLVQLADKFFRLNGITC